MLCVASILLSLAPPLSAQQRRQQAQPAAAQPAAAGPIALRGGRLLTVTKGVIENGVLVMEGGKITAVGAAGAVAIPRNAQVIDVSGMTVYPGLIDSETRLGLTEVSAVPATNDMIEPSATITPHMQVHDAFHAESAVIPVTRINGVTNAIVAPAVTNTLPGQSALIQLAGRDSEQMVLVRNIALPVNFTGQQRRRQSFGEGGRGTFPATRMGVAAELRQALLDAQHYARTRAEFEAKRKPAQGGGEGQEEEEKKAEEGRRPKRDLKLEALLPYLEGKKPVVLAAEEPSDIQTALRLAKEFNLRVILNRITYAHPILDEIAALKVPVVLGEIYSRPLNNQRYDAIFRLPAELHKRGVKFAFASFEAHNARNLPYQAGYAVAWGLPYAEALKAVTIYPAEIWGVADQLGSLEPGKTANVVVANGDPLDMKTDVKRVFIAGQEIPMRNYQTDLRDEYSRQQGVTLPQ